MWSSSGRTRASRCTHLGATSYTWVQPDDAALRKPLRVETFGSTLHPTSNVLAVGDGFDAPEILRGTNVLSDGIRAVYIDPPFNTQKTFNQYGDSMATPMWLSMMRDRLAALRPLLREDASVWLHLDDSEVHRARVIMDEVFGEAFVASVVWQKRTTRDSRAAFSSNHDTILVYAPSGPRTWKLSRNLLAKDEALLRNRDDDPRACGATRRSLHPAIAGRSSTTSSLHPAPPSDHRADGAGMPQKRPILTC